MLVNPLEHLIRRDHPLQAPCAQMELQTPDQLPVESRSGLQDTDEVSPLAAGEPAAPANAAVEAGGGGEGERQAFADVAGGEQARNGQGLEGLEKQGRWMLRS